MEKTVVALFFALIPLTHAYAAEITADHHEGCYGSSPCVYFKGEIKSGDLIKLKSVFDSPTRRRIFVFGQENFILALNSRGGSLEEAMEIGRWVRKNKIVTTMGTNSECFSSCVYILAAGVIKLAIGSYWGNKVGIHRPYLTRMPKGGIQVSMKNALADSKAYLAEMNVPEHLADAMFSISPDKVEILTDEKLTFYRLTGRDIVYEEETELKTAYLFGMTRQEYMRNKSLFEEETKKRCFPLSWDEGLKCIQSTAMKFGLHESQMKQSQ